MAKKKRITPIGDKINIYRMVRDVLIRAIDKGQLPLALFGIIVIVILLKMPGEDVSKLAFRILELMVAGKLIGYILSIIALVGWFVHARTQRRTIVNEINRLSAERDKWQRKLIGDNVTSSEEKK